MVEGSLSHDGHVCGWRGLREFLVFIFWCLRNSGIERTSTEAHLVSSFLTFLGFRTFDVELGIGYHVLRRLISIKTMDCKISAKALGV